MSTTEITKRVFNPVTGKYYSITKRSSKYAKPGEIRGIWSTYQDRDATNEIKPYSEIGNSRVFNPVTDTYYEIRRHSSKYTKPGEIKGLWSSEKKKNFD